MDMQTFKSQMIASDRAGKVVREIQMLRHGIKKKNLPIADSIFTLAKGVSENAKDCDMMRLIENSMGLGREWEKYEKNTKKDLSELKDEFSRAVEGLIDAHCSCKRR